MLKDIAGILSKSNIALNKMYYNLYKNKNKHLYILVLFLKKNVWTNPNSHSIHLTLFKPNPLSLILNYLAELMSISSEAPHSWLRAPLSAQPWYTVCYLLVESLFKIHKRQSCVMTAADKWLLSYQPHKQCIGLDLYFSEHNITALTSNRLNVLLN